MNKKQDYFLDLRKLRCPEPIMLIRKKMREINFGNTLLILSDDPSTIRDIPKYCQYLNHKLLKINTKNIFFQFLIKKCNKKI
ncbi:MAG: sulfurtransferase TusA [Buchnera aphidicola (Chaetogeoica yunlongensis)]